MTYFYYIENMKRVKQKIEVFNLEHKGKNQFGIKFKYDEDLLEIIRNLPHAKWSKTKRLWYLPYTTNNLNLIKKSFKDHAEINLKNLNQLENLDDSIALKPKRVRDLTDTQRKLLNNFFKYLRGKRYSKSTINTYTFFVADFIEFHKTKTIEELTNRDVELFIETVFIKRKYSISTQRQFISAIKVFKAFCPSLAIDDLALVRPKKSKKLPSVLSPQEVISIIQHTRNLKHRAILALTYSSGLRIGELLNLKIVHFNIERKQLLIKSGKGRKDRYVTLAESFYPLLNNYLLTYKPETYFVEGTKGKPYSASSIRKFLSRSCKAAGIKKQVTPHVLRHSYATHLLENGVGLRHIQELLGHAKPETTMIYTHVARKDLLEIQSPLDTAIMQLSKTDKEDQKFLLSRKN